MKRACFCISTVVVLLFISLAQAAASQITVDGVVQSVSIDILNPVTSKLKESKTHYSILTTSGRYTLVLKPGEKQTIASGQRIRVRGVLVDKIIYPKTIASLGAVLTPGQQGPQPTAVLMINFPDSPQAPQPASYFQNIIFGMFPSLATLWAESSHNSLTVTRWRTGVYGWFTMPRPYGEYQDNFVRIAEDALATAYRIANIEFSDNDRVILVFDRDFNCQCAAATLGFYTFNMPYGQKSISVSWDPLWTYGQEIGQQIVGHEYGHNIGFQHSGMSFPYDSIFDVMSGGCTPEGPNTIVPNMFDAGWLPPGDIITVTAPLTEPREIVLSPSLRASGARALKILTSNPNVYYTAEVREDQRHDQCLFQWEGYERGVALHRTTLPRGREGSSRLIPSPHAYDILWRQYSGPYNNPYSGFALQVLSEEPSGEVRIRLSPTLPGTEVGRPDFPEQTIVSNTNQDYIVTSRTFLALGSDGSSAVLSADNAEYLRTGQLPFMRTSLSIFESNGQSRIQVPLNPDGPLTFMTLFGVVADQERNYYAIWSRSERHPEINDRLYISKVRADGIVLWGREQEVLMPRPERGYIMFEDLAQDAAIDREGNIYIVSMIADNHVPSRLRLYFAKIDSRTGDILLSFIIPTTDQEYDAYSMDTSHLAVDPRGIDPHVYIFYSIYGGISGQWTKRLYLAKIERTIGYRIWEQRLGIPPPLGQEVWPTSQQLVYSTNGMLYALWDDFGVLNAQSINPSDGQLQGPFTFTYPPQTYGSIYCTFCAAMAVDGAIADIVYNAYDYVANSDCHMRFLQFDLQNRLPIVYKQLTGEGAQGRGITLASRNGRVEIVRADNDVGRWCGNSGQAHDGSRRLIKTQYIPTVTGPSTVLPGSDNEFKVYALRSVGNNYLAALSFATSPGIPISRNRTVPLNPDILFYISVLGLPLLETNSGVIDANGIGRVTLHLPNEPLTSVSFYLGGVVYGNDIIDVLNPRYIRVS